MLKQTLKDVRKLLKAFYRILCQFESLFRDAWKEELVMFILIDLKTKVKSNVICVMKTDQICLKPVYRKQIFFENAEYRSIQKYSYLLG